MFGIVIDTQGFKVEFVHIFEDGTIDSYVLKDGESIIEEDWQIANSMNKPQRVNGEWVDTEPLPPAEPSPTEPDKNTILLELQEENKLLKAQVNALNGVTDFHEELIVEMANKVYA